MGECKKLRGLSKRPSTKVSSEIVSPTKGTDNYFLKLFKKIFVISVWIFSCIVLLNMEPVSKATEALVGLDSFLRYVRGEDTEFEHNVYYKYNMLENSLKTVKDSVEKSFNSIKELIPTFQTSRNLLHKGYQVIEEKYNFLYETFGPREIDKNNKFKEP